MLEDKLELTDEQIEGIASQGPWGAFVLCGISTLIVVGIWFAFYFFAFLPRGVIR
jgi:hypothetical protein